jgi:hypothetical protein
VVLAVAGAATFAILADALVRRLPRGRILRSSLAVAAAAGGGAFVLAPFVRGPAGSYVAGEAPALYRFLEAQPKDALVASISPEADNLPAFARRSVLVAGLYAVPYQLGYYLPFRRRVLDLLRAEYAEDPRVLRDFVRANGVDFILLDRWSFRPRSLTLDSWVKQYRPLVGDLASNLGRGAHPALERMASRCTVLETEKLILVDATCLLEGG